VIGDVKREFVDNTINQCCDKPKDIVKIEQFLPSASTGTSTLYLEINGELV
jgi:hypothetical protein